MHGLLHIDMVQCGSAIDKTAIKTLEGMNKFTSLYIYSKHFLVKTSPFLYPVNEL